MRERYYCHCYRPNPAPAYASNLGIAVTLSCVNCGKVVSEQGRRREVEQDLQNLRDELAATEKWLNEPDNKGKHFSTDTTTVHFGTPTAIDNEEAMAMLQRAFSKMKDDFKTK